MTQQESENCEFDEYYPSKKQRQEMGQVSSTELSSATISAASHARKIFSATNGASSSKMGPVHHDQTTDLTENAPSSSTEGHISKGTGSQPIDINYSSLRNNVLLLKSDEATNAFESLTKTVEKAVPYDDCLNRSEEENERKAATSTGASSSGTSLHQPRVIFPRRSMTASLGIKNPAISKSTFGTRNELTVYRDRILSEVLQRKTSTDRGISYSCCPTASFSAKGLLDDKENNNEKDPVVNGVFREKAVSQSRKRIKTSDIDTEKAAANEYFDYGSPKGLTALSKAAQEEFQVVTIVDGSECEEEHVEEECLVSATPSCFETVGDIIGYAKVIRAQRNYELGRLNNALSDFSAAFITLRAALEQDNNKLQNSEAENPSNSSITQEIIANGTMCFGTTSPAAVH